MALKNYFYGGYRWQYEEGTQPEGAVLDEPKAAEPKPAAKAPTKRRTTANKRRTTANKSKGA